MGMYKAVYGGKGTLEGVEIFSAAGYVLWLCSAS